MYTWQRKTGGEQRQGVKAARNQFSFVELVRGGGGININIVYYQVMMSINLNFIWELLL